MINVSSQALCNAVRELRHGPWLSDPQSSGITADQIPGIPDTPDVLTKEEMAAYRAKKLAKKQAAEASNKPISSFQQAFQPIYDNPLILPVSAIDKKYAQFVKDNGKPEGYPIRVLNRAMQRRNDHSNPSRMLERHSSHKRRQLDNQYSNRHQLMLYTDTPPSKGQEILRKFHQDYLAEYNAAKENKPIPQAPQRDTAFSGLSNELEHYRARWDDPLPPVLPYSMIFAHTFFRMWSNFGDRHDLLTTIDVDLPYLPSCHEFAAAERRNQQRTASSGERPRSTSDVDRMLMPPPASTLPIPATDSSAKRNFHCLVPGCSKSYKHLQGLRSHAKKEHPNLPPPSREQYRHLLPAKVEGKTNEKRKSSVERSDNASGVPTKRLSPKNYILTQEKGVRLPHFVLKNPNVIRTPRIIPPPSVSRSRVYRITDPTPTLVGLDKTAQTPKKEVFEVDENSEEVVASEAVSQPPPSASQQSDSSVKLESMAADSESPNVHDSAISAASSSNESISAVLPMSSSPNAVQAPAAASSSLAKVQALSKPRIKCAFCPKTYATHKSYMKHIRDLHPHSPLSGESSIPPNVIYRPAPSQNPLVIDLTGDDDASGVSRTNESLPVYNYRGQRFTFVNQYSVPVSYPGDNVTQVLDIGVRQPGALQLPPDGSYLQMPSPMSMVGPPGDTSAPPRLMAQQQPGPRPQVRLVQTLGPRRSIVKINPGVPLRPSSVRYSNITYRPTGQTINQVRVVPYAGQQGPRMIVSQTAVRGGVPVSVRPVAYMARGSGSDVRPGMPMLLPSATNVRNASEKKTQPSSAAAVSSVRLSAGSGAPSFCMPVFTAAPAPGPSSETFAPVVPPSTKPVKTKTVSAPKSGN